MHMRMGGFNPTNNSYNRTIASSLVIGENVFTPSMRGRPLIAFRAGGEGNITGKRELWSNNLGADVPAARSRMKGDPNEDRSPFGRKDSSIHTGDTGRDSIFLGAVSGCRIESMRIGTSDLFPIPPNIR
jgi:hypothetical protein